MKTYPINLILENQLVMLIGAGKEMARKLPALLESGARVRIIAPAAHEVIRRYAAAGKIEYLERCYQPGDLAGAFLVIAATGDRRVQDAVWEEANAGRQLVNAMDAVPRCNFHAPAVLRRGQLTIAIGTGGAAPALAAALRQQLEPEFGPEYAEFVEYARALRPRVARSLPRERRADFWHALIESDALALLRQGERALLETKVQTLLSLYKVEPYDQ